MPPEKVASFGENTPLGRAGQPAELAPVYVLRASDEASYISGARVAVTGGRTILWATGGGHEWTCQSLCTGDGPGELDAGRTGNPLSSLSAQLAPICVVLPRVV